mgnify:CR=1 FL=1
MFQSISKSANHYWIGVTTWIVLGLTVSPTRADLVVVQNPGFEDVAGSLLFNEFSFGPPVGWQIHNPNGVVVNNGVGPQFWLGTLRPSPPTNFFSVPEGQRVAISFNEFGTGNLGEYGLSQTLSATLQANTRYELAVEIGNIASGTALNGQFFNLNGFPGYRVDLLAGGVVIASDNNSLAGTIAEGEWGTSLISFETTASHLQLGQALGIRLVNLNVVDPSAPTADLEVDFDHVRLSATAVPEPSSGVLLGFAIVVGAWTNRPRRR